MFEKNLQEFFVIFFELQEKSITDEGQNQNLNHVACP